jgi:peptidylprolyl isomerase domain and WD repeat-containing protein 1
MNPVTIIMYNSVYDAVLSVDTKAMIEYWTGPKTEYQFPKNISFSSKLDTDLFEFVQNKLTLYNLTISPNGQHFATLTSDRRVIC